VYLKIRLVGKQAIQTGGNILITYKVNGDACTLAQ